MPVRKKISNLHQGELKEIPVSKQVKYQYVEKDGKTYLEGLVASDRWYPGLRINGEFYFGLHYKDYFIPGIAWCNSFIPGLLTKNRFYPGLIFDKLFLPGIFASGAFVHGIIKGNNFVPGILRNDRFNPGCFTVSNEFVPGRFYKGDFQSGTVQDNAFKRVGVERLSPKETKVLSEEGYGFSRMRRYDEFGGLPVRGIVTGMFEIPAVTPDGMITNQGVILGRIPSVTEIYMIDLRKEIYELLSKSGKQPYPGIPIEGPGPSIEEISNEIERSMGPYGDGIPDLNQGMGGGAFDSSVFDLLRQGDSDPIDALNKGLNDSSNDWIGAAEGLITEGSGKGPLRSAAETLGEYAGKLGGGVALTAATFGFFSTTGVLALYGTKDGRTILGGVTKDTGKIGKEVANAAVDAAATVVVNAFGLDDKVFREQAKLLEAKAAEEKKKAEQEEKGKGGGTKQPDNEGRGGGSNFFDIRMRGPSFRIINPYKSRKLVEFQNTNEGPAVKKKGALASFVVTDTGMISILNYETLRQMALYYGTIKLTFNKKEARIRVDLGDPTNIKIGGGFPKLTPDKSIVTHHETMNQKYYPRWVAHPDDDYSYKSTSMEIPMRL